MEDLINLPLVTIGIVTYNQEVLVKKSIESVLAQGYPNIEIIISDDCSKDSTWQVISSYKDPRIRAFKNAQNLYQYKNRNTVFENARGKYLLFIDGDDLLYPHGIEYMVRMLEAFPNCGCLMTHYYRNNLVYPVVLTAREILMAEYFEISFLGTALTKIFFNVEKVKAIGGFPTHLISSDDLLRLRLALNYPILITDFNPAWWRETPGQESGRINFIIRCKEKLMQMEETFSHPNCPLTEEEKYFAIYKVKNSIVRNIFSNILKLKWKYAYNIYKVFGLELKYLKTLPKEKANRTPYPENSISNPLTMPFDQNPYSSLYNKKNDHNH